MQLFLDFEFIGSVRNERVARRNVCQAFASTAARLVNMDQYNVSKALDFGFPVRLAAARLTQRALLPFAVRSVQ